MVEIVNSERIARRLRLLHTAAPELLFQEIRDEFEAFGEDWKIGMGKRVRDQPGRFDKEVRRTPPGQPPKSRSGKLRRSFRDRQTGSNLNTLKGTHWSDAAYAYVQEFGTAGKEPGSPIPTIRPKTSKYLTIPMPAALTPTGRPKLGRTSARQWPDTFVFAPKSGGLFIARTVGKRERIELLYALKRSVDLPARLGMRMTFEKLLDRFPAKIDRAVDRAFRALLRRSGGR